MTAQKTEIFHFEGKDYVLMGFHGDKLLTASDFGLELQESSVFSTALYRGYIMHYGIDESSRLIVKHIKFLGNSDKSIGNVKPVKDDYYTVYKNINQPVAFSGYLLFGESILIYLTMYTEDRVFEAHVTNGKVKTVQDISAQVHKQLQNNPVQAVVNEYNENPTSDNVERLWEWSATCLSRKYDTLYLFVDYIPFEEQLEWWRKKGW